MGKYCIGFAVQCGASNKRCNWLTLLSQSDTRKLGKGWLCGVVVAGVRERRGDGEREIDRERRCWGVNRKMLSSCHT